MIVKTRYNKGDKVWYYLDDLNKYAWGKVQGIDISVTGYGNRIVYTIENRFFKEEPIEFYLRFEETNWQHDPKLVREEDEVFKSYTEVVEYLTNQHRNKIDNLEELKKGFFR